MDRRDSLAGCLLGCAVGDALGLPWEGLSARRVGKKLGPGPPRHRFLFGRGMVSDDTEHTVLTAQALLRSGRDLERFRSSLAWGLRGWLLGLPAGIGLATLKATLRLWVGVPPHKSGVRSAGNGPAMRAAILGVALADDPERLKAFVDASSVMTHTDRRAVEGAWLVAEAARLAALGLPSSELFDIPLESEEWRARLIDMKAALEAGRTLREFAESIGSGGKVTGFVMTSVPVALFAWLSFRGEFQRPVEETIRLGGDTDTTAAIVGGLCGAEGAAIPKAWLEGLWEWPRGERWMRALADRLASGGKPLAVSWPLIPVRNALFLGTVLYHGLRRLA